ncbi:MAG TPA: isoprenylcysteine carboxylmethyltransferase family protein [Dissulfurispiraceae bacterium]
MANRDKVGRIGGTLLFGAFLMFHLAYLHRGWQAFDTAAKINSLLITCTIALFLSAYFLRTEAVAYSKGLAEAAYPVFCAALPLVIYHDVEIFQIISPQSGYYGITHCLFGIFRNKWLGWNIYSMALVLTGNFIVLAGITCLRRSFSITVEAREPVYEGIYQYVRHPLYLGESVATLGVLLFRCSKANIFLTALFIACQAFRAQLEERKLLAAFPSYWEYRQRTGAVFPKLWRKSGVNA